MKKEILILTLVVGLVLITGVQAYQINEMKDSGDFNFNSKIEQKSAPETYNAPTYNNQMVGGC